VRVAQRSVARAGSVWPGARPSRRLCLRLVGHGGGPEEAGELASDGDGGDVARLAACAEAAVEAVQPSLCTEGDLEYVVGLAGAAFGERATFARAGQVVPGGLDQQPACLAGAGLGDRALAAALARLVERGDETEPAGELGRTGEAREVADLEAEHEGGERVAAAEAAEAGDGL
jgi:hypothetical protein